MRFARITLGLVAAPIAYKLDMVVALPFSKLVNLNL